MWTSPNLVLRPVTLEDLSLLETWDNVIRPDSYNFFSLNRSEKLSERFSRDGFLSETSGKLVLCLRDEATTPIGSLDYRQVHYGPPGGSSAFEIGIELLLEQRGKGYGSEAQASLTAYLFAVFPVARVQASTDLENVAEQRALEKAGFTREGALRRAQWRMGAHHDLVMYSKLRGE